MVKVRKEFFELFSGLDMQPRRIPIVEILGKGSGPTLIVSANCHGDEVTGIEAVFQLIDRIGTLDEEINGRIIFFPMLNIQAAELCKRAIPLGENDLNRSFRDFSLESPSNIAEVVASRISGKMIQYDPAMVIDLHSDARRSIAYIILDRDLENSPAGHEMKKHADIFGAAVIWDFPPEKYRKKGLQCSLTGHMLNVRHIPSMTLELPGKGSINKPFVSVAVNGVLRVMRALNIIEPEVEGGSEDRVSSGDQFCLFDGIETSETGILDYHVEPGQWVKKGEKLATVRNMFGEKIDSVTALHDGFIISLPDSCTAFPGCGILSMAVRECDL